MKAFENVAPRLSILSVGRRVRFRHLRRAVAGLHPRTILDAGCGGGDMSRWLTGRFPGAVVVGIDADEREVARATARLRRYPQAEIRLARVGGPSLGRRFDLVVCTDVLEHLVDDNAGLDWLAAHLAPSGSLVIHVPALDQLHPLGSVAEKMREEVDAAVGPHFREGYSADGLAARLTCRGIRVVDAGATFHSPLLRWLVDIDQWLYFSRRRGLKICARPLLLAGSAVERRPKMRGRGHGVLLVGRGGRPDSKS